MYTSRRIASVPSNALLSLDFNGFFGLPTAHSILIKPCKPVSHFHPSVEGVEMLDGRFVNGHPGELLGSASQFPKNAKKLFDLLVVLPFAWLLFVVILCHLLNIYNIRNMESVQLLATEEQAPYSRFN